MQPAGCTTTAMVKRQVRTPRPSGEHLKYVGITRRTLDRYRKQVSLFFRHLHVHGIDLPDCLEELDNTAAEYVNHMWQEGEPAGYASDLVAGLKRLYPRCRKHLAVSTLYCKIWSRSLRRKRALAVPAEVLIGMAGLAYAYGEPRVGVAFLVGFLGLLRTGELLELTVGQLRFFGNRLCVLALGNTKTGQRKGFDETVLLHDPVVISLLRQAVAGLPPGARIFNGSFQDLKNKLRSYAADFGVRGDLITPYCLRRGGATWHFTTYASMDATQAFGRWEHAATAKQYVNQAVADSVALRLDDRARALAERGQRLLAALAASPSLPPSG